MRLQLLQRKYPERASDFDAMQQDISRGIQTLENLLLLARLDPEHAENLPKTHFALHTVIDEAIQALTPFIKQKAIQIQQRMVVAEFGRTFLSCVGNQNPGIRLRLIHL